MTAPIYERLRDLAALLEANAPLVAGAIADSRDTAPRLRDESGLPLDRDSADVLVDVIDALRAQS